MFVVTVITEIRITAMLIVQPLSGLYIECIEQRQLVTDPQTKPVDFDYVSACIVYTHRRFT